MHEELELQSYVRYMLQGGNATGFKLLYFIQNDLLEEFSCRKIAEEVGVSFSQVSKELRKLQAGGWIKYSKNKIVISS